MKNLILFLLMFPCLAQSGALNFDASLGSFVGENNDPYDTAMPFWADLIVEQPLSESVSVEAVFGHRSNADRNGNEYNGEYWAGSVVYEQGWFIARARMGQFINNDDQENDDWAIWYEAGVQQGPMRFTGFLRETWDTDKISYRATGVKIGYEFNLWEW